MKEKAWIPIETAVRMFDIEREELELMVDKGILETQMIKNGDDEHRALECGQLNIVYFMRTKNTRKTETNWVNVAAAIGAGIVSNLLVSEGYKYFAPGEKVSPPSNRGRKRRKRRQVSRTDAVWTPDRRFSFENIDEFLAYHKITRSSFAHQAGVSDLAIKLAATGQPIDNEDGKKIVSRLTEISGFYAAPASPDVKIFAH